MKRLLILIFILSTSTSRAEVVITKENHIQNVDRGRGGLCTWACLESLGRTHGWKQLNGLTDSKSVTDYHNNLVKEMQRLKVNIRHYQATEKETWHYVYYQPAGKIAKVIKHTTDNQAANNAIKEAKDLGIYWIETRQHWKSEFLFEAIKQDLGAAVSIDQPSRHLLILAGADDLEVRMVDSNYSPGKIRKESLGKFLQMWNGFAIVIEKNK
jgi:hypothetical protein